MAYVTYYVDKATGDDDANDGLSEGSPFETIQKAVDTAETSGIIYVKASDTYTEQVTLDDNGSSLWATDIIGYSTTPGDNGMATIDGENTRNHGFYDDNGNKGGVRISNFRVTRCVAGGFYLSETVHARLINCQADNNGTVGIDCDDTSETIGCYSYNNGTIGIKIQYLSLALGCVTNNNGSIGLEVESGECVHCIALQNDTYGIHMGVKTAICSIFNCTVDGIDKTTDVGIYLNGGQINRYYRIVNTVVANCSTGIKNISLSNPTTMTSYHNLIYNNTVHYDTFDGTEGLELSGVSPQFINASGGDVTPLSTSPLIGAGLGLKTYDCIGNLLTGGDIDIGAVQSLSQEQSYFAANMMSLFIQGPSDGSDECSDLYFSVNLMPLFLQGEPIVGATYVDRTIHEYYYHPNGSLAVVAEFDSGESVNIQVWSSGLPVNISSSGCTEVDSTGKYIWPLRNLPYVPNGVSQYQWRMTDGLNTVNGDFILRTIEGGDGGMPSINPTTSYIVPN